MPQYQSKFGGLWIDQTDRAAVQRRINAIPDPTMRQKVFEFERSGYSIFPGAVSHAAIDEYLLQYDAAGETPDALLMSVPFGPVSQPFERAKTSIAGTKVLDTAMLLPVGDSLTFAPAISRFLEILFGERALAFQALHFHVGSMQAIHQDTTYVVVDREPLRMAASWIALEDIRPGSGELIYFAGGHRIEHLYNKEMSKHFNAERDGHELHHHHLHYLHQEAARRGLAKESFLAKKGDVLLWHADLPHGGSDITQPGATRRALVTHYCPASLDPYYFQFLPNENRRKVAAQSGNFFCSMYFPPDRLAAFRGQEMVPK